MPTPTTLVLPLKARVPADTATAFAEIAARNGRSISAELRLLVEAHVEANRSDSE